MSQGVTISHPPGGRPNGDNFRMIDFSLFEKKTGVNFKNKNLLREALTHRSYLNENPKSGTSHNERLEFLGDAVLELVVSEYLYKNYLNPEGELTSWRASLVNAEMLGSLACEMGFDDFILLSRGEIKEKGKARHYILANAFEAVVGAIYLDQGMVKVKKFVQENLISKLPEIIQKKLYKDPKSLFQEASQEITGLTPHYKVIKEWGPDHAKRFSVGVFLGEELIDVGEGSSKQEAEQEAAKRALRVRGWQ